MKTQFSYREVPMGFVPIGFQVNEETGFGVDWHEIKIDILVDHFRDLIDANHKIEFEEMKRWCAESFGQKYENFGINYHGIWVLQDFGPVKNFIFLHKADAMAFKLRFG